MASELPSDYAVFLQALKERIRGARFRAALAVNRELILLYWDLGRRIAEKQRTERWGTAILERISCDLREEFGKKGYSRPNLYRMSAFYRAWEPIRPQPVGKLKIKKDITAKSLIFSQPVRKLNEPNLPEVLTKLPWGHNAVLAQILMSRDERLWYAEKAVENGWSRGMLIRQIKARLHLNQGKAQTNFAQTLPAPQAKLAQEALKDEYALDFVAEKTAQEKDIERAIIENAQRFLMELGKGFAFIGRQHRLQSHGREYIADLLLYHALLHCYVVVELKSGHFLPDHVGKLSAYLTAADALLRRAGDEPSIGLILCRSKDRIMVEYALRDQRKPIGVACYRFTRELPGPLQKALPTPAQIEEGLKRRADVRTGAT